MGRRDGISFLKVSFKRGRKEKNEKDSWEEIIGGANCCRAGREQAKYPWMQAEAKMNKIIMV